MTATHTPGPWATDERYPGVIIGGVDEHGRPSQIASATLNGFRPNHEREANARLIAAAPDMLQALKAAEEWLSGWASAEPYIGTIRAAIAKAGTP